ncbi:aminotransferase class I/II-fold pyridoxal phosphate-dependent enzyme [Saccharicrinis fermentans]|uniref:Aspartate aminotransferase n=1 Tax=Saccharicrinis fermentans DSM 9555 = JCM 21142 TaxID=869213 RepID=W7YF20_9BACT|nr:pyridoxal phosphate-dependent aminotransferase [Saccharicrinis fermentans]GAF03036.1 aspartate aminotransferase [Saccharicrinis fermentans DSM 9555 = JCM 21142]
MKHPFPAVVNPEIVEAVLSEQGNKDLGKATIREVVNIVNKIEERSPIQFIRMEMGVPSLPPSKVGVNAEIEALKQGVASKYPMLEGIKPFKQQASRFAKAFMDIDVPPESCIPTVGSMQASYALFMAVANLNTKKNTILFIDPGFPVQKIQLDVLGIQYETFDVFEYRGAKLRDKLESYLLKGNIAGIVYSNPNNPTWICFHEDELETIGRLAEQYDTIIIEDLAYFGMDFRQDISTPFQAPFQPTVAKYTSNYAILISSSKAFSYAGQRLGTLCISHELFKTYFESLKIRFGEGNFGQVIVGRLLYSLSAGASHSAQYAIAAIYKAACDGSYNYLEEVKEYGIRARLMKELFIKYGFSIIYNKDIDEPIADGFYFTISYPGMMGGELLKKLLYFGISGIALTNTGSKIQGLRACVSQTEQSRFGELEKRLQMFQQSC